MVGRLGLPVHAKKLGQARAVCTTPGNEDLEIQNSDFDPSKSQYNQING